MGVTVAVVVAAMPRRSPKDRCGCGRLKGVDSERCVKCHVARQKRSFRIPGKDGLVRPMPGYERPMKKFRSGE